MTPKQTQFVEAYCSKDTDTFGNATQSYRKAYTTATMTPRACKQAGARLLTNVVVKEAIQAYRATQEARQAITRDYITAKLQDQYDKADTAKDRTNALRAIDLLGKTIGIYIDSSQDLTQDKPQPLTEDQQALLQAQAEAAEKEQQFKEQELNIKKAELLIDQDLKKEEINVKKNANSDKSEKSKASTKK